MGVWESTRVGNKTYTRYYRNNAERNTEFIGGIFIVFAVIVVIGVAALIFLPQLLFSVLPKGGGLIAAQWIIWGWAILGIYANTRASVNKRILTGIAAVPALFISFAILYDSTTGQQGNSTDFQNFCYWAIPTGIMLAMGSLIAPGRLIGRILRLLGKAAWLGVVALYRIIAKKPRVQLASEGEQLESEVVEKPIKKLSASYLSGYFSGIGNAVRGRTKPQDDVRKNERSNDLTNQS